MNLQIINPITYAAWDELMLSQPDYSFFHSSHWARVLHESYGYKPLYFSVINNGKMRFALPLMEISSLLTGRRAVSLPFTDYCGPLVNEIVHISDMFDQLCRFGEKANWKYLEIRGDEHMFAESSPSSYYFHHILELSRSEGLLFDGFRKSTQRNINKAIREGVQVAQHDTLEALESFYSLNCLTRKMHGLPPQPFQFFKKIYEHIISKKRGILLLATYRNKIISGAIFFHFGKKAAYKYGASDKRHQHLRANNLVMWEAIRYYCNIGYKSFCFGRTEEENNGLRQFKKGWGTIEKIISYFRYDIRKSELVRTRIKVAGIHNRLFHNMPIPLLKVAGSLLYKHVG